MQKNFLPINQYHIDQWKNKGLLPKDVKLEKSGLIIKSILKFTKFTKIKLGFKFI